MAAKNGIYASVYFIILNYNGFEDTKACIESLNNVVYPNKRIILVDNASTDKSSEQLRITFPHIPLIVSEKNLGYAGGLNLGVKVALKEGAEYILLSNNDVIFSQDFLKPMIELAQADEKIGIVSSKVMYLHNTDIIYCAGGELNYCKCGGVAKYQGKNAKKFGNENRLISLAEGCCLLVKSEVFRKVGLMDENFFMYFEEVDFSRKVSQHYNIIYCSSSKIFHKSGAGHNWAEYSSLYYYYYTRNRLLCFKDSNIFYFLYVILFSTINSIAKSIILGKSLIFQQEKREKVHASFNSLWKGFRDGMRLSIKGKL